jgi:hypothetical protein
MLLAFFLFQTANRRQLEKLLAVFTGCGTPGAGPEGRELQTKHILRRERNAACFANHQDDLYQTPVNTGDAGAYMEARGLTVWCS